MTAAIAVHLILVAAVFGLTAHSLPPSAPNYETKIACEGNQLQLACEEGTKINLIRANFGRFSISICNLQGNLEWSVNCEYNLVDNFVTSFSPLCNFRHGPPLLPRDSGGVRQPVRMSAIRLVHALRRPVSRREQVSGSALPVSSGVQHETRCH